MRTSDALLLAPAAICGLGAAAYVLTDMGISELCLLITGLSLTALVLHWMITRARR